MSPYEKLQQKESLEWIQGYDEETADGYLEELEDESKPEND